MLARGIARRGRIVSCPGIPAHDESISRDGLRRASRHREHSRVVQLSCHEIFRVWGEAEGRAVSGGQLGMSSSLGYSYHFILRF